MEEQKNAIDHAVALATAWLGNPNTRCTSQEVHEFVRESHAMLVGLSNPTVPAADAGVETEEGTQPFVPAVTARKSVANPEFLISLIDGKPYRALRRHLTTHGLTPEDYRERYGLKPDYPMVAPAYSAKRSRLAKELGLGRKVPAGRTGQPAPAAEGTAATADAPRGRGRAAVRPAGGTEPTKGRTAERARGSRARKASETSNAAS